MQIKITNKKLIKNFSFLQSEKFLPFKGIVSYLINATN